MQILHIQSSILAENSQSRALAHKLIQHLSEQAQTPVTLHSKDLAQDPIAHLEARHVQAFHTPAEERTPEQAQLVAISDAFIEEVRQADLLVIDLPMYNFNIPSQLKAYFDQLARAGITFAYTPEGPKGLLEDKPVYLVATRGGLYKDIGLDYQVPYVHAFLRLLGLTQVHTLYAEGLNMPEHREISLQQAQTQIQQITLKSDI
ncbi:FMN-dependent NADH-azoreductase [Allopseudospirillum japonicum]|uniref:FMN dependent NADH:quinone oxidoreductase n=1 Tax=Allopseudospirillum japonicum TaxID=64971 RepID=A0A1H6SY14_9GAMM|nr:NAD(P)H-dependent oxidoreductase [Allopseudospirillum japonicum]SEI72681.1 FMN-dependent NADH-azoreductase [Allopseudospirillum japonicum]